MVLASQGERSQPRLANGLPETAIINGCDALGRPPPAPAGRFTTPVGALPTKENWMNNLRNLIAVSALALGTSAALAAPPVAGPPAPATAATRATPAIPATPATPADPATGSAAIPAEPATPATAATVAAKEDPLSPAVADTPKTTAKPVKLVKKTVKKPRS